MNDWKQTLLSVQMSLILALCGPWMVLLIYLHLEGIASHVMGMIMTSQIKQSKVKHCLGLITTAWSVYVVLHGA